jgi:hypothetical protein
MEMRKGEIYVKEGVGGKVGEGNTQTSTLVEIEKYLNSVVNNYIRWKWGVEVTFTVHVY